MTEPKQRGGAQPGAGRKKLNADGSKRYSILFSEDLYNRAIEASPSEVRKILDKYLPKKHA